MFKNALVYRIEQGDLPAMSAIEERLQAAPFVPCSPSQSESAGWVPPRGDAHGALLESVGGQWVLKLRTETRAVPGSAVKTALEERLDELEKATGHRPKGKAVRELKDEVVQALLPRAFGKRSDTLVWVDGAAGLVWVGATGNKRADALLTRLRDALGADLGLALVQTALSPAGAMAGWLQSREAPAGFSIDRDCELKQPDGEKATVRYARHSLDMDEVGEHIQQGKRPTALALTWAGRVSFTLAETLALKKIKLLDVVLEGASTASRDEGGFDADVALFSGELRLLWPELLAALGGLQADGVASAGAPAPAAAPAPPTSTSTVAPASAATRDPAAAPWD